MLFPQRLCCPHWKEPRPFNSSSSTWHYSAVNVTETFWSPIDVFPLVIPAHGRRLFRIRREDAISHQYVTAESTLLRQVQHLVPPSLSEWDSRQRGRRIAKTRKYEWHPSERIFSKTDTGRRNHVSTSTLRHLIFLNNNLVSMPSPVLVLFCGFVLFCFWGGGGLCKKISLIKMLNKHMNACFWNRKKVQLWVFSQKTLNVKGFIKAQITHIWHPRLQITSRALWEPKELALLWEPCQKNRLSAKLLNRTFSNFSTDGPHSTHPDQSLKILWPAVPHWTQVWRCQGPPQIRSPQTIEIFKSPLYPFLLGVSLRLSTNQVRCKLL